MYRMQGRIQDFNLGGVNGGPKGRQQGWFYHILTTQDVLFDTSIVFLLQKTESHRNAADVAEVAYLVLVAYSAWCKSKIDSELEALQQAAELHKG